MYFFFRLSGAAVAFAIEMFFSICQVYDAWLRDYPPAFAFLNKALTKIGERFIANSPVVVRVCVCMCVYVSMYVCINIYVCM